MLKSLKYGETSLIATIFTASLGVESYIVQGVRTARGNKAALLQPGTLLELVAYQKQQKSLQRLREYSLAHLYTGMQQEVVKNSIALFSLEVLLRLLPERAPLPELFDFSFEYLVTLDVLPNTDVANFPLYFVLQCTRFLGYDIQGAYTAATPYLNLHEGGFSELLPALRPFIEEVDAAMLARLMEIGSLTDLKNAPMNSATRARLLDWLVAYLQQHSQHMAQLKSLDVLRAIFH